MVDFQSRDRRRGDDDTEDETEDDGEPTETADVTDDEFEEEIQEDETADFGPETIPYAVVAVTDERAIDEDVTGDAVVDAIETAGDAVATRELIHASYDSVQSTLGALVGREDVSAIVTVGGAGVEPDDVTVEAAKSLFDKHLPGFGELFRVLSHEQDGTAVVRTRTTAGIVGSVPVFCLPGETVSARRGVEQIVLEEAGQLAEDAAIPSEESESLDRS